LVDELLNGSSVEMMDSYWQEDSKMLLGMHAEKGPSCSGAETHGGDPGAVAPGKKKKKIQAKIYFQAPVSPR
jgi:hypothetical protein